MALFQTDLKVNDTYILKGRPREIRRCLELTDRSIKFVRLTGPRSGHVSWGTLTKFPNRSTAPRAIPIAVELVQEIGREDGE